MIGGDRLIGVRDAVAKVVRESHHVGVESFADRIERGQADDSQPMLIGLAVAERIERDLFQ